MKKLFEFLSVALLLSCFSAGINATDFSFTKMKGLSQTVYTFRDTAQNVNGRFAGFAPLFVVYPDAPCDESQAAQLVRDLGIDQYVSDYSGSMMVVNPLGQTYNDVADLAAYDSLVAHLRVISNMKIIGIGRGATFVNNAVSHHAEAIAGIVSINGKMTGKPAGMVAVPAYICGKGADKIAAAYATADKAVKKSGEKNGVRLTNSNEELLSVVYNPNAPASLKEAFNDAWDATLSRNYRFNNYKHTWYEGAKGNEYGAYELEPYLMLDRIGVKRNAVEKNLFGTGTLLWYEYFPKGTENAAKGSIPLVLLLHGNTNDPRTQAETSGFIEEAARENFVVAELEWQGGRYTPMGIDGIEQVVYYLLKTYPQLDASRVYTEGLSAGSFTSNTLGVRRSYIFAAIGGHSGGVFPSGVVFGADFPTLMNDALQKRGFVDMPYLSICGTDDHVVMFPKDGKWKNNSLLCALQIYQTMNGIDVVDGLDFSKDATFGVRLENREVIHTNKGIDIESGTLSKDGVPLIKLMAVDHYGHWNFKPAAHYMYEYFKHFSRNPQTKKLIYHP